MLNNIIRLPAAAFHLASFLKHPALRSVAAERGDSAPVVALAKRIRLSGWYDPPSAGGQLSAEHSLSYRRLPPWDQATIKLTIAKFLLESFRSALPSAGVIRVTLFGTCGREKDPQAARTTDYITGFEFRGRQFALTKPLRFEQGCGVELPLD